MVYCRRSLPPRRGLLLLAFALAAIASLAPAADRSRSASGDGYPPLLNAEYQTASQSAREGRSRMPEITPPDAAVWTAEDEQGYGNHFAGYLPDAPEPLSQPVAQFQSSLPQTSAPRAEFSGNETAKRDDRPREGNRGLRLRKRHGASENLARADDKDQNEKDVAEAKPKRRSRRSSWPEKKRNRDDVALARKNSRSEVMDEFRRNPARNDSDYVPFLGTVEGEDEMDAKAPVDDTEPRQELGEAKSVARSAASEKTAPVATDEPPARDKYADMVVDVEEWQEDTQHSVAQDDTLEESQSVAQSAPPSSPPVRNPPQIADLEPWRQQQYMPRPTRAEVEDYRRRLEQRLLERYNNLPRFAGKVGKVSVVLSKQLDESLDGNLIRAEFDQLVYDPWGKRIPELEQEYYVVTFGAGGAKQVRSDPSVRVGLDMEKTYSERAPLNADPFRNVPEQKVFHSAPTAKMPDWWRPDFPELNQ